MGMHTMRDWHRLLGKRRIVFCSLEAQKEAFFFKKNCGFEFDSRALVAYILHVKERIIICHLVVCCCYDDLSIALHTLLMLHGTRTISTVRSREWKVSL